MAEQKESSVLFSLKELMSLEENRIREEDDAKKKKAESEAQAKLEAERRAREDEEARLHSEEERRRAEEMRRKMEEAQIEAAKAAELEKRRLEDQHRLQMEAMSKQQAHEREIQQIQAQKRKGLPPAAIAGIAIGALSLIFFIIFLTAVKPSMDAKEAIKKAQIAASGDDPSSWADAESQLAIAKEKDPSNKDIAIVAAKVQEKRDKKKAADDKILADREAEYKATKAKLAQLQNDFDAAKKEFDEAGNDAAKKEAAAKKMKAAQAGIQSTPTPTKKACPPGVPLCN